MSTSKYLILRLSSLGDVILASSALEVFVPGQKVDWVIAKEFKDVLEGHPKLNTLIQFDRQSGFNGWIHLCRKLWQSQYTDVFDLHKSLRTSVVMRL